MTPAVVVVGFATSESARIFVAADQHEAREATIAYSTGGEVRHIQKELTHAPPCRYGVFELAGLPTGAEVRYTIRLNDAPASVAARLEAGEGDRFRLLPNSRPLRIALLSCNGQEDFPTDRKHAPWRRLGELVAAGEVDLLVHAGDQVYADEIWNKRVNAGTEDQLNPEDATCMEELIWEYREIYLRSWRQAAIRDVLASVPSVMMWDDHEIVDGWGSHEHDHTPPRQALLKAAKEAFSEFQASHGPPRLDGVSSFAAGFEHNGVAVLMVDARSHRDYQGPERGIIVGATQWKSISAYLDSLAQKEVRRLYVVTGVPPVHVKTALAERILADVGHHARDDLRDGWAAGRNLDEGRSLLLRLFNFMTRSPRTEVTLLGGDVHVATVATISSRYPIHQAAAICNPIYQVTSSGIGTAAPSGVLRALLSLLKGTVHLDIGHTFDGRLLDVAGTGECFLGVRNFAVLSLEEPRGDWSPQGNLTVEFYPEGGAPIRQRLHRLGPLPVPVT